MSRPAERAACRGDVVSRDGAGRSVRAAGGARDDDRLYRALDRLLWHKEALQQHLVVRLGDLFALDYDLLLYDVTSVYFEGAADTNPLAQRGHSRDHRGDCKQVCLTLVVSRDGMPIGYEVFAGNRTDATAMCRAGRVETFVLIRSIERREKERAMHERFARRIETGLERLGRRVRQARRPLDVRRLERQLGRLLERNQRAAGRYVIEFVSDSTRRAGVRLE